MNAKLILGSSSPRRKEILSFFRLPFMQIAPLYEEKELPLLKDPKQYVQTLAKNKALSLTKLYPDLPILAADTIVYHNQMIYNKPQNYEEAFSMLSTFSDNLHYVYTAISVAYNPEKIFSGVETSSVFFHKLTKENIGKYLLQTPYLDRAGAYSIQENGAIIVKKIEGCFYNVMGLPISLTKTLLEQAGIDLWDFL